MLDARHLPRSDETDPVAGVASLVQRIRDVVGPTGWLATPEDIAPHLSESRGLLHGHTALVVRPRNTAEVAEIVRLCAAAHVPIVPQGGNTGLCGGGAPVQPGPNVVLSLGRMNRIRSVDPANYVITVEAGCILARVQEAAAEAGCLFPLSLGAEGSCQIGGNLSTNAGGVQVLRYGNMRDLTLGLEVVLPDATVWNGLKALRKDNTGYDLKQLFIGAEGTLGIITAATLRLYPKPLDIATAWVGFDDVDAVIAVFNRARQATGDQLTAFEMIPRFGVWLATTYMPGIADPLRGEHPWYALLEVSSSSAQGGVRAMLEAVLEDAMETGLVQDAAIATTAAQANAMWRIREAVVEAQKHEGGSIKHDVAVPVSAVPDFIRQVTAAVCRAFPAIRPLPFGHCGDGNIHFNFCQEPGLGLAEFLDRTPQVNRIVHDIVSEFGGSISAEHGIGRLKKDEFARWKDPVSVALMRRIKTALDPHSIMNAGAIFSDPA
jgi:D-lactate dehydrogenase (cytochrome)